VLTFPQVLTFRDIILWPDDDDPNLYYPMSGRPRLRFNEGQPVLRGLFWTDAADGTAVNSAGVRGALLNFDVNLAISDTDLQAVKEELRKAGIQHARREQMLNDERERLQRQAKAQGQDPGAVQPHVPEVGEIRFGSVMFTGGKVTLLEEKDGGFVEWSSAGGPPSLIGENNAAFAFRLGAEGAAVWYRALQQDAAAIGVRYELQFAARLPSVQIHVWAGSHEQFDLQRKVERTVTNEDQGCGDADVEHADVKSITEHLVEDGLVNIEIIKGAAQISDEVVGQLRSAALSMITERVKEILMHRLRGISEEERKTSLIEMATEEITAFAELRLTQRDVIAWGVNPQATITDFLGGLTGEARSRLITLVDMSDPIVATLEMKVSVGAPWTSTPQVTSVVVDLEYAPAGEDAARSLVFQKDTNEQTVRWRRARRDGGDVRYKAKAFLQGAAAPIPLPGGTTNGHLHIEMPLVGTFAIAVKAPPDVFTATAGSSGELSGIQVDYEYKTDQDPDHAVGSAVLRKEDTGAQTISANTFRVIDAPVILKPTYLRKNGPALQGTPVRVWAQPGQSHLVEIPSPWRDVLQINCRVPPGILGLKQVGVELRYEDTASDFISTASVTLDDTADWFAKGALVQSNKENQRFKYRYSVRGVDQLSRSPWIDAEGDQELILPVLGVHIRLDRLKLGTTYSAANLNMHYGDPAHGVLVVQEIFVDKTSTDVAWLIPRVDPTLESYTYSMTLFSDSGTDVTMNNLQGAGSTLFLPPPAV